MGRNVSLIVKNEKGFSLIELIIVMVIISIMTAVSLFYLAASQRLYKPDDQALKIADILQEARQRALTQTSPMRVEIDLDDNVVRLIDERLIVLPATLPNSADDILIRQMPLLPPAEVFVEERANNVTSNPPEPGIFTNATFTISNHPLSIPNNVCTLRFLGNGTVTNAGTGGVGNGAVPTSVILHVWSPSKADPEESEIARALTVSGASGLVRLWEYNPGTGVWKDSRR